MDYCHVEGLDSVDLSLRGCALTIGNFDGVHLGHQRIVQTLCELKGDEGKPAVVLTFEPSPDSVLRPKDAPRIITPTEQKLRLLAQAGADCVVLARTDLSLLRMSPQAFVEEVVVGRFAPLDLVEGRNFRFGRDRGGDVQALAEMGRRCGFRTHVVDPILVELSAEPVRVSSSLIRELIETGRIAEANRCLGREFALHQRVVSGMGYGRIMEFPTVNIDPGEQIVPADGVYAGRAAIGGGAFAAAISIGNKPTLGPAQRTIEAFLIDASGDFYDKDLALRFVQRLRQQVRFESTEQLKAQIAKDVQRVREICR